MYGSELRTCGLGAVVAVLLGAGIGLGWHYLDNVGGKAAVASVATPFEKQDAPKPPLSCPPGSRGGPALDVPQLPVLSRANNQPDPTYIRDGRIYQDAPGLAFLPPNGDPAVAKVPLDQADAANGSLTMPKAIGLLLIATQVLWLACQC